MEVVFLPWSSGKYAHVHCLFREMVGTKKSLRTRSPVKEGGGKPRWKKNEKKRSEYSKRESKKKGD